MINPMTRHKLELLLSFIWNTSGRASHYMKYGSLKFYYWKLENVKQTWTTYWDLSHEESIYRRNLIQAVTQQRRCLWQWHTCVFKSTIAHLLHLADGKKLFLTCFPLFVPSLSELHVLQMNTADGIHFHVFSLLWHDTYDTFQSIICSKNIQDVWLGPEQKRESNRGSDYCVCMCWAYLSYDV